MVVRGGIGSVTSTPAKYQSSSARETFLLAAGRFSGARGAVINDELWSHSFGRHLIYIGCASVCVDVRATGAVEQEKEN